ncbi:MAG TPA: hypothetical protein VNW29_04420 [Candidatus Sulfotelmatobacter sp.]|jgi:hypothetical protein|nr:hypothetical protein [Candidatus Sulfotelmatobacter sp.]
MAPKRQEDTLTTEAKLETCKVTKQIAGQSLAKGLHKLLATNEPISEVMLRDAWLTALRKNASLFPDGWYMPPPHGIAVVFGSVGKESRSNFQSLRPQKMWPQDNIFLNRDSSLITCYASPVDKKTGMFGDFGVTLYFGNDSAVKSQLQQCLQIDREIFDFIEVGKSFAEVYTFSMKLLKSYGLANDITSNADPTTTNIGHTVSGLDEAWTLQELHIIQEGETNWDAVKTMIGKKRKFVNSVEQTRYMPGMGVTLEPRPTVIKNPEIPMVWLHNTILINPDGSKELLTSFEDAFRVISMDYMLTT